MTATIVIGLVAAILLIIVGDLGARSRVSGPMSVEYQWFGTEENCVFLCCLDNFSSTFIASHLKFSKPIISSLASFARRHVPTLVVITKLAV